MPDDAYTLRTQADALMAEVNAAETSANARKRQKANTLYKKASEVDRATGEAESAVLAIADGDVLPDIPPVVPPVDIPPLP